MDETSSKPAVCPKSTPHSSQLEANIILWLQQQIRLSTAQLISLWRHFGNYQNVLESDKHTLAALLDPDALNRLLMRRDSWSRYQPQPSQPDVTLLPISSPNYPQLLQQLYCPPPLLYVRGNIELLSLPQLAIVGGRKHTASAGNTARAFAQELCRCGFTITSGLALGIDSRAHLGALETGKTVAVLASGVERIYPQRHQKLAQQIVDNGGALISEMPPSTKPLPAYFPQRNRIISGLSLGVLVVEAARKSGSLITARCAIEQGREVFAIPGSIHNPSARGCHQLIREGATLVETVDDIAEQLGAMVELKRNELPNDQRFSGKQEEALSPQQQQVLHALDYDPVDFDTLSDRTGHPASELTTLLLDLELKGVVEQSMGKYIRVG